MAAIRLVFNATKQSGILTNNSLSFSTAAPKSSQIISRTLKLRGEVSRGEGMDGKHWRVVMNRPKGDPPREEIIDTYVKTLATAIGCTEDEAKTKIYSTSTRHYYAFGAQVSEEIAVKIGELPRVAIVFADMYMDKKKKKKLYAGEPFSNGKSEPYDPKNHVPKKSSFDIPVETYLHPKVREYFNIKY